MQVTTLVGAYLVTEVSQLGLRVHLVDKEKRCTCGGTARDCCAHIQAVSEYLKQGGEQAPEAVLAPANKPPGSAPVTCPICGSVVKVEAGSPIWRCLADSVHYWQWRGEHGGVRAFLTKPHPAKMGAFYEQTVEEREAFLARASRSMHSRGYVPCA